MQSIEPELAALNSHLFNYGKDKKCCTLRAYRLKKMITVNVHA